MKQTATAIITFSTTGFVAGLCSGLSVVAQPLGVVVPGILFGVAIVYAANTPITPLSSGQKTALIVLSTIAYLVAIAASLLSVRLPGFDNGLSSAAFSGAIAGFVGALIVAFGVTTTIRDLRLVPTIIVVSLAGSVFGAIFMLAGIYISDHTSAGHPFDDIVSFPLWQAGVASAIPIFRRRQT